MKKPVTLARGLLHAIAVLAPLALAACAPLPAASGDELLAAPSPVDPARIEFLSRGATTVAEVVDRLGPPALVWEEARLFVYSGWMRQGALFSPDEGDAGDARDTAVGPAGVGGRTPLLIRFDESGRVERFERATLRREEPVGAQLRDWVNEASSQPGRPVAPSEAVGPRRAGPPALVLMRFEVEIDGAPAEPFPRRLLGADTLLTFSLVGFETAGVPMTPVLHRFLSDASRAAGWAAFQLDPGTWYFAAVGPDSDAGRMPDDRPLWSTRWIDEASLRESMRRAPRWRIDVPPDARVVYAGTLRLAGRSADKPLFGKPFVVPLEGAEPILLDETPLASELVARELPKVERPRAVLMQRWREGDPLVFRAPLAK